MGNIAIYGFGRVGRTALKVALKRQLFTPGAVSDVKDLATLAALFEVDTDYGRWHEKVTHQASNLLIGDRTIRFLDSHESLPNWGELGVELVIDCSGRGTTRKGAQAHLDNGAKKVLISAASKTQVDADAFLLPGINLDQYDPKKHHIVSMASCTSNALAPVIKVLLENYGVKSAFFSTVHAYTNTQSLTDQPMKDRRDSWAATENIIPASSGAARALQFIWPALNITGKAYRVPVRTGSIAELNVITEKTASAEEIKNAFRVAANTAPLQGVMDVLEEEWASSRILGDEHSSIIDLPLIQVLDGNLVSIAAWYDNEMGYAARLAETATFMLIGAA